MFEERNLITLNIKENIYHRTGNGHYSWPGMGKGRHDCNQL